MLLNDARVDPSAQDNLPLIIAGMNNQTKIMKLLLRYRRPDLSTDAKASAVFIACVTGGHLKDYWNLIKLITRDEIDMEKIRDHIRNEMKAVV